MGSFGARLDLGTITYLASCAKMWPLLLTVVKKHLGELKALSCHNDLKCAKHVRIGTDVLKVQSSEAEPFPSAAILK